MEFAIVGADLGFSQRSNGAPCGACANVAARHRSFLHVAGLPTLDVHARSCSPLLANFPRARRRFERLAHAVALDRGVEIAAHMEQLPFDA